MFHPVGSVGFPGTPSSFDSTHDDLPSSFVDGLLPSASRRAIDSSPGTTAFPRKYLFLLGLEGLDFVREVEPPLECVRMVSAPRNLALVNAARGVDGSDRSFSGSGLDCRPMDDPVVENDFVSPMWESNLLPM